MKITILGESAHGMAEALADRLREAGATVAAGDLGADHRPNDETLAESIAASDAVVDLCVVDRALKGHALRLTDDHLPAERPLWTCCHATSATYVAASTHHPERVHGFALLPPWEGRERVECARPFGVDDGARDTASELWRRIGLQPTWVADATGLVLPRIVAALANEAAFAVMEGLSTPGDIDRAMRLGTRYPRGPLAWSNEIGLSAVVATLDALAAEHGEDRYRVAPLLRRMALVQGRWEL